MTGAAFLPAAGYPPDLPDVLRPVWDASRPMHGGDEAKFRWWLSRVTDYLTFWELVSASSLGNDGEPGIIHRAPARTSPPSSTTRHQSGGQGEGTT